MKPSIKVSACYRRAPETWAESRFVCKTYNSDGRVQSIGFGPTMRDAYLAWEQMVKRPE